MKLLLWLNLVCALQFIALPSHNQAIKTYSQIDKYFKLSAVYFKGASGNLDSLVETAKKEVFMFLEGKELAAFLMVSKDKCYSISKREEYDFFSFYYCTVLEHYRGQGLSYKIMLDSVQYLKNLYKLRDNTILSLHISPYDDMMPVAARMYYSLGFRQGVFIKSGPNEMAHKIDELFYNSKDLFEIAQNEKTASGDGFYLMLYCKLKDFKKGHRVPNDAMDLTRKLYGILKRRQSDRTTL
ncbi:uncharacterized protein VICG_00912 [Vittaforma corneae ATCC 50505]|uniref:N-acetyltransferase domain-containing protein n=1 Tax=Vittaforma corneae (strain ATCC 50505) TaxID=993615 RepID=L2GME1_VITCO|nr:uncharacterized protein VICG_00912 [Vittaforma corneae ATCC 50505]ELA42063.1 hypothetical protein VICG_00912 [Vittaforma corneae ATCC 50505]